MMKLFRYKDSAFNIIFRLDVCAAQSLIKSIKEAHERCISHGLDRTNEIWRNPLFTSNNCRTVAFKRDRSASFESSKRNAVMVYYDRGIGGEYCSMRPLYDDYARQSTIKAYLSFSSGLDTDHDCFDGFGISDYGVNIPLDYILEYCHYRPKDVVVRTCITLQKKLH